MRALSYVIPTFWTRGSGKKLRGDKEGQILALYLMTAPASNWTGLYYQPLTTIAHETGLTIEEVREALKRIGEIAKYDEQAELVWCPAAAEHQIGKTLKDRDHRRVAIIREVQMVGSHPFAREFIDRYSGPYKLDFGEAPSKPLPSPFQGATDAPPKGHLEPPTPSLPHTKPNSPDPDSLPERARRVLENPHDGHFQQPSKWPEVQRIGRAWSEPFGIRELRLRDTVSSDADLRTILAAIADGYDIDELCSLGKRAKADEYFKKLNRPGPAAFTAAVIRRLMGGPGPVPAGPSEVERRFQEAKRREQEQATEAARARLGPERVAEIGKRRPGRVSVEGIG